MPESLQTAPQESPDYLRMSLAAAMTLGLKPGLFHRGAKLHCINLLETYSSGCAASCAYCGLSRKREGRYGEKSFIRVSWPSYHLDDIIERIADHLDVVKRVCISQITNKRCITDTVSICRKLRKSFDVPVSILVSPTILTREHLVELQEAGADKIGVALDAATPALFDKFRGSEVGGPHTWDRYIHCLEDAIEVFGPGNAGSHLVTGLGETEKQMAFAIQMVQDMGGWTHLFSFFPEASSLLADHPMPDMDHYRRIQLVRYLIDKKIICAEECGYSDDEKIIDFRIPQLQLDEIINSGEPFRTSGCPGYDGAVACNRPYANSRPGPDIRNFPFAPELSDIARIRNQMGLPQTVGIQDFSEASQFSL
jgi:biotin synthase